MALLRIKFKETITPRWFEECSIVLCTTFHLKEVKQSTWLKLAHVEYLLGMKKLEAYNYVVQSTRVHGFVYMEHALIHPTYFTARYMQMIKSNIDKMLRIGDAQDRVIH